MASSGPLSLLGLGKKTSPPPPSAPETSAEPDAGGQDLQQPPFFRVVKGSPTDEELAVLTAVLVAERDRCNQKQQSTFELWQSRLNNTQQLGAFLRPGPGSWKRARPQ